jgi:transcriptional regulator with XRE-family HTH domain
MLSEQEIITALQDRRLAMISEATGISRMTLTKIRSGRAIKPSYNTMRRISNYLEGKPIED